MIESLCTNLMVTDMTASLDFYHRIIGLQIAFSVNADRKTDTSGGIRDDAVFASLHAGSSEVMLQERHSMIEDANGAIAKDKQPGGGISLYFRCDDVDAVVERLGDNTAVVKPLQTTWYGMKEIWLRDPDGWIVTLGCPDGSPPPT